MHLAGRDKDYKFEARESWPETLKFRDPLGQLSMKQRAWCCGW